MTSLTVNLNNHQRTVKIQIDKLTAVLQQAAVLSPLAEHIETNDELAVQLLGKRRMAQMNREYLGHRGATDVISFSYLEDSEDFSGLEAARTVGELFICPAVAADHVKAGTGFESIGEEVVLYGVHGILHLAGYDDQSAADVKQMRTAEQGLMKTLSTLFTLPALAVTGRNH